MKKIFLISYHLDDVPAGPAIRFKRYAPMFLQKGYRLAFVAHWHDDNAPRVEHREYYDVYRIKSNYRYLKHTLFIFKAIILSCTVTDKPSAVFTLSINIFQLLTVPILKLTKTKLIYINTMKFSLAPNKKSSIFNSIIRKIYFISYKILFSNIASIVASSEKLIESFKEFKLPIDQTHVIHNGVDTDRFHPVSFDKKINLKQELVLPLEGKIILYIGLKTERKGLLDLYESWLLYHNKFPSDHLLLVGDEKAEANSVEYNKKWGQIKDTIKNTSSGIILRGNSAHVEKYFQIADAFIFLSHKEGMPNVLLEAMASGTPVITTEFDGFSDVYGSPGKTLLIVERNHKDISDQICLIINDNQLRNNLISNALNNITTNHTVNTSIKSYIDLINH